MSLATWAGKFRPSDSDIERAVSAAREAFGVEADVNLRVQPRRSSCKAIAARQYAAYLLREGGWSFPSIAVALGYTHHSSVMYGIRVARRKLEEVA